MFVLCACCAQHSKCFNFNNCVLTPDINVLTLFAFIRVHLRFLFLLMFLVSTTRVRTKLFTGDHFNLIIGSLIDSLHPEFNIFYEQDWVSLFIKLSRSRELFKGDIRGKYTRGIIFFESCN